MHDHVWNEMLFQSIARTVWIYQRGNQKPKVEGGQTTQWSKEKELGNIRAGCFSSKYAISRTGWLWRRFVYLTVWYVYCGHMLYIYSPWFINSEYSLSKWMCIYSPGSQEDELSNERRSATTILIHSFSRLSGRGPEIQQKE